MTLAEAFSERLVAYRDACRSSETVPSIGSDESLRAAQFALVDTVAVTLLGSRAPCASIARSIPALGASGPCVVVGSDRTVASLDAAFFNGIASHADDYDDFTELFGGHPSVPVFPAVLALAEEIDASGLQLLQAYIAGVELENRIAMGVHFHHYEKGWHPTATLGVFGAAAGAAHLLELDVDQTATALAIAASSASGLKANFGSMTKPFHVGQCARNGLQAALLAAAGFSARADAFEHHHGFLEVYNGAGTYRPERMLGEWFDPPLVVAPGLSIKEFPCCGSTHPAIYMALKLREEASFQLDDIASIDVAMTPKRLPHTDNPAPTSDLEAKFSVQYTVARALLDGPLRLSHFENHAYREARADALMAKVNARPEPALDGASDNAFGALVEVKLHDGKTLSAQTEHLPGRGELYPMTMPELADKFRDCASRVMDSGACEALLQQLQRIDSVASVRALTAALRFAPASAAA